MRLDHVQVAAPPGCEAEARRFYGALLGLPELEKPEPLRAGGGVWFALGAQQLHEGFLRVRVLARRRQRPPGRHAGSRSEPLLAPAAAPGEDAERPER